MARQTIIGTGWGDTKATAKTNAREEYFLNAEAATGKPQDQLPSPNISTKKFNNPPDPMKPWRAIARKTMNIKSEHQTNASPEPTGVSGVVPQGRARAADAEIMVGA